MTTAVTAPGLLDSIYNHFSLTWRLFFHPRVSFLLKLFLIGFPITYGVMPFLFDLIPDFIPLVGFLDDLLLFLIASLVFVAVSPPDVVRELRGGRAHPAGQRLDAARYPTEKRDLAVGFMTVTFITLLTGSFGGLTLVALFVLGYIFTAVKRAQTMSMAVQVTEHQLAHLYPCLKNATRDLPPVQVNLMVQQNPAMNAFAFGYHEPYTIVLTSGLVEHMSEREIQAVIGHELGHILFGHMKFANMLAGLPGLTRLLFFQWSRSCEYSADRVAYLAAGCQLETVASVLLKITSGLKGAAIDMERFLKQANDGDRWIARLLEFSSTHPLIDKRIHQLVDFSRRSS